jgi:enterochelin esterase-like enzyme
VSRQRYFGLLSSAIKAAPAAYHLEKITDVYSNTLQRQVDIDIFLPPNYHNTKQNYPLLVLNDGQDSTAIKVKETLETLTANQLIQEIIVVGIYANDDRLQEYGIATQPDYKERGSRAALYTQFITTEMLPYIFYKYRTHKVGNAIAGYSLGGLSAFDIAWHQPQTFAKVGVFSGALWWRSKAYHEGYDDSHRITHNLVKNCPNPPKLKFWFETGTHDETEDRNQNGVIDSIDDTLDLITELVKKGYRAFHDVQYVELQGGKHEPATWAMAMPQFLQWAFGR